MANQTDPDDLLRWMTDNGRLSVQRWLRAESLEGDVLALLDELGVLTDRVRARVLAVGRVNVAAYDHDLDQWFTPAQIRRLYERNPVWAGIELELYGNLVGLRANAHTCTGRSGSGPTDCRRR